MGKESLLKFYLVLGDIVVMYLALFLAVMARSLDLALFGLGLRVFMVHFSMLYPVWILFLFTLDFYEINFFKKVSKFFSNLFAFSFGVLFLGIAYFYFRPQLQFTPKTILLLDIAFFAVLFFLWRWMFSRFVIRHAKERVIVVGQPPNLAQFTSDIQYSSYEVTMAEGVQELAALIKSLQATTVVFTDASYRDQALVSQVFSQIPLDINFLRFSEFYEILAKKIPLATLDEIWFLEEVSRAEDKIYLLVKRLFDIVLALSFFLAGAALFPFIALAIKLDSPGPVLYNQQRVGKNRNIFTLHKFRTMQHNGTRDTVLWRETQKNQITRVGAFLRRFHLDELPQSVSILKGDLSFVGPRPEWLPVAEIFEREIPFYRQRYNVQVGFTGWAAINFPPSNSVASAKDKFEYDLYYMKNRSFFLDLEIILKTVRLILK